MALISFVCPSLKLFYSLHHMVLFIEVVADLCQLFLASVPSCFYWITSSCDLGLSTPLPVQPELRAYHSRAELCWNFPGTQEKTTDWVSLEC